MRVVLSYALQSSMRMAIDGNGEINVVLNALVFTRAPIVVHISRDSLITNGNVPHAQWVQTCSRVHVNPEQLTVVKASPSILAAHLSNFAYCDQPGMPCDDSGGAEGRFVLLAQNVVLFRHGLEAWVARHTLSFCLGNVCTDIVGRQSEPQTMSPAERAFQRFKRTLAGKQAQLEALAWEEIRGGSLLFRWLRGQIAALDDRSVREAQWNALFVDWMEIAAKLSANAHRNHTDPLLTWEGQRASPLSSMPHEGSFFPFSVMRHFRHAVRRSILNRWLRPNASLAASEGKLAPLWSCSKYIMKVTNRSNILRGGCSWEELLLPTFVWQKHPDLLAGSSPNTVMRVWDLLSTTQGRQMPSNSSPSDIDVLTLQALDRPLTHGHLFGIKVPHFQYSGIARSLPVTLDKSLRPLYGTLGKGWFNAKLRSHRCKVLPGSGYPAHRDAEAEGARQGDGQHRRAHKSRAQEYGRRRL